MADPVVFKRASSAAPAKPPELAKAAESRPQHPHTWPREVWILAVFAAGLLMGSVGAIAVTTALFHPIAQVTQEGVAIGAARPRD